MRKFFLTILCLGCALGGESPALDVAAKLLEDYQQQRKACGDEDALQVLRLKIRYTEMKAWTALETDDEAYEQGFEDMRRRFPNTEKLNTLTGWKPQFCLDDIIRDVAEEIKSRQG